MSETSYQIKQFTTDELRRLLAMTVVNGNPDTDKGFVKAICDELHERYSHSPKTDSPKEL